MYIYLNKYTLSHNNGFYKCVPNIYFSVLKEEFTNKSY